MDFLKSVDNTLSKKLYRGEGPIANLLARSCSGFVWIPVTIVVAGLGYGEVSDFAKHAATGLVLNLAVGWTLKALFKRERPTFRTDVAAKKTDDVVVHADNHSFPSMHAARAMMLVGVASYYLPTHLASAALVWGVSVGLSRLSLGRHYPSDVAAGFVEGCIEGSVVRTIVTAASPFVASMWKW